MGIGEALLKLIPALVELNKGQPKKNSDKFPSLKTRKKRPDTWWDSLNSGDTYELCGRICYHKKTDAGSAALHFGYMTANYPWWCSGEKYADLPKGMKKRVDAVFDKRNKPYSMFDLAALFKLQKI